MKFGTLVQVERGDSPPPGTPGCHRFVDGVPINAGGDDRIVRLTEDDPLDTTPRTSESGHYGYSPDLSWCESENIRISGYC